MFEDTLERQFDGRDAVDYLWRVNNVMTFVKVDKGLAEQVDGVRMMHPLPDRRSWNLRSTSTAHRKSRLRCC